WRSELAGRRAVVVLDNAAGADQVRLLLPGAGPSVALITSRNRLLGLEEVPPVSLDVLTPKESAWFLRRLDQMARRPATLYAGREPFCVADIQQEGLI
ncbi:hypothetical protein MBA17_48905, partial [Streptosporangium sp. KLBMP 9127]|nr:hypothetical protein [Streptosporangium sp. KLBMP 9127]